MSGLRLFVSNRLEILADRLAGTLSPAPDDPLEEEVIVVQSAGMQRWVSMALAARNGICANVRFPYPKAILRDILSAAGARDPLDELLEPEILAWRIFRILTRLDEQPLFAPIRNYLAADAGDLRRFQLASRLAYLYDQYLVFRPDRILRWEKGGSVPDAEACQAGIWRILRQESGGVLRHLPAAKDDFFRRARELSRTPPAGLPRRICLFGISYLPRQYLEIFHAASTLVETNFFLLNPSREFWMDIRSGREIGRLKERKVDTGRTGTGEGVADYWETGNSLLASFGAMGRDFFNALIEYEAEIREEFAETDAEGILGEIQRDILYLRDRPSRRGLPLDSPDSPAAPQETACFSEADPAPARPMDFSLQIHSCHSPMREVEVLYDRLLGMFEEDPLLKPSDILVMAPDISVYAPLIRAVFEFPSGPADAVRIPYGIADRSVLSRSSAVRIFFAILSLADSRFELTRVLDILEEPAVHRRFDLTESDLDAVRRWTDEVAIRWGIDAEHRRRLGLPPLTENTWRAGLERLLLGYAMMGSGREMFQGIVPSRPVEGDESIVLGRFVDFVEKLIAAMEAFVSPRSLAAWGEALWETLEDFFSDDREWEDDVRLLQAALRRLGHLQQASGNADPVDLQTVRWQLERAIETGTSASGYLARGVTFCSLLPMRSIPAEVVCLLGMNYADYPRKDEDAGFNLIAASPRPGDRSKRGEDRYLFLEAILSARRRLYISYIGQSIEDNSAIPPSVLVSELLDYAGSGVSGVNKESGRSPESLVTKHPLQAFSPSYFSGDKKLFSYSSENFDAARCLVESCDQPPPFVAGALAERSAGEAEIDIAELAEFFANPARSFLEKRLGVFLPQDRELPQDAEPFDLAGLEKYRLEQVVAGMAIEADGDTGELYEYFRARGALPHGTAGRVEFEELAAGVRRFSSQVRKLRGSSRGGAVSVELPVGGRRLWGTIEDVVDAGLVSYRYGRLGPKDHLRLWIRHLALSVQDPQGTAGRGSILIGREEAWRYRTVEKAKDILEGLISIYLEGQNEPVPFFPASSWEYARRRVRGEPPGEALRCARQVWRGSDFLGGEEGQPHLRICFRNRNPLDASFAALAERILRPLLETAERLDDPSQMRGSRA